MPQYPPIELHDTLYIALSTPTLVHILLLGFLSFLISMSLTPLYTTVAYQWKWWKKQRTDAWSGGKATVYAKLHAAKHKRHIPTMGGIVFVLAITIVTLLGNLYRSQTWLPLAGLVGAGAIGLVDDLMNIRSTGGVAGMQAKLKFLLYSALILVGGWWFYSKLGIDHIYLPGLNDVYVGAAIIAIFWFVVMATANAVNITDGLDGLAGGLLVTSFITYAMISAVEGRYALAGF
jgi:phospho-N-acetylmuramoyl-pentapeptide-transferase